MDNENSCFLALIDKISPDSPIHINASLFAWRMICHV